MNREETKKLLHSGKMAELVKTMTAFANGEEVQYRMDSNRPWLECKSPAWPISGEYRVKPREPKVIYVNEYERGESYGYPSKERALAGSGPRAIRKAVKYVEVIEE